MKNKKASQRDIILEYFHNNPERDISHPEIVDWAVSVYKERTGEILRDPDRMIRKLKEQGILTKVAKGVYRYSPETNILLKEENFSEKQKKIIFERDGYICARCGRDNSYKEIEFHIDHIIPKEENGKATLENGQVLCSRCNFIKKHLKQTETGKRMFINLYNLAKQQENQEVKEFCEDLLLVYEKYNINGHIVWKK